MKTIKSKINQKGQALLFVVVTMTIALALGVGVSLRTLSSISRVATTDSAARALAAAEGGAERFLTLPDDELEKAMNDDCPEDTTPDPGPANCIVDFGPTPDDPIVAQAIVTIDRYGETDPGEEFSLTIKKDQTVEIDMDGYGGTSIEICWSALNPPNGSDLYYVAYGGDVGSYQIKRRGLESSCADASCFPSNYERENFISTYAPDRPGYNDCISGLPLPSSVEGLRIHSINDDSKVGIFPTTDSLPVQGYKITSVGQISTVAATVEAQRTILVYRSLPYLPGIFDFGIYSNSGSLD